MVLSKAFKIVLGIIIVLILGGLVWFGVKGFRIKNLENLIPNDSNHKKNAFTQQNNPEITQNLKDSLLSYTHPLYGFSFFYPASFKLANFSEGEGEMVLLRGAGANAQIYTEPFDEDIILTAERIRKDLPDMEVVNPLTLEVGNVPAVSFSSGNGGLETKEIWLIKDKRLYQISSQLGQDMVINEILNSWQWND